MSDSEKVAQFIGPIIRKARTASGMTQTELGEALGLKGALAKVTICNLELGKQCPSLPRLFALAAAFGLHPMALLDETAKFRGVEE
jgi:transcriptional regulator with XRE-family HTH domain